MVEAYEIFLTRELESGLGHVAPQPKNSIEQVDVAKRASQMSQLIQAGLEKTEKAVKVKGNVQEVMEKVLLVKDLVDTALEPVPQAAIAWAGVCFGLQVRSYSIKPPHLGVTSKDIHNCRN